jgi:cytochrome c-type biogenesis protein CcmF
VRTSLAEDLYVTLMAYDTASGAVTLRAFVNPFVVWIWLGGAIVAVGAIFAIWPERRAVTAPAPQTARRAATVDPSGATAPAPATPMEGG